MYKNLVFKKALWGIAMIFISLFLLSFVYMFTINDSNEIFVFALCGGLYASVWYYVFFIYFLNIKIKPISKETPPPTSDEIKNKIQIYFKEASQDNEPIFLVEEIQGGLQISWNRTIDFKQILNYGSKGVNYKTCLFFDEQKHICDTYAQIIHTSKSAGLSGLSYSMDFKGGLVYETGANYHPSFEVQDGEIHVNIKKLSYNNASIIDPIIEICKANGWTTNFLIFKHKIVRMIYTFSGWILLSISLLLFFFGMLGLILGDTRG